MKKLITAIAAIATSFGLFAADAFTTSVLSDIQSKTNNLVVGYDTTGATMLDDTGDVTVNWFADSLKTDFTTKMETYEQPELKVGEDEEGSYQYLAIDTDVGDPVLRTFKNVVEDTGVDNFKYNNIEISDHGVFIDTTTTFTLFDTVPDAPGDSKILVWARETEADEDAGIAGATNLMVSCGVQAGLEVVPTNYVLDVNGIVPEQMYRLTIRADKDGAENTKFRVYLDGVQLKTVPLENGEQLYDFPSLVGSNQELGAAGFGGTGSLKGIDLLTEIDAAEKVPFAIDLTCMDVICKKGVGSFTIGDTTYNVPADWDWESHENAYTTNIVIDTPNVDLTMDVTVTEGYKITDFVDAGAEAAESAALARCERIGETDSAVFNITRYTAGAALRIDAELDIQAADLYVQVGGSGEFVKRGSSSANIAAMIERIVACRALDSSDPDFIGEEDVVKIKLLIDVSGTTFGALVDIDVPVVLDLAGHSITALTDWEGDEGVAFGPAMFVMQTGFSLTIMDSEGGGSMVGADGVAILACEAGTILIEDVAVGKDPIEFHGDIYSYYGEMDIGEEDPFPGEGQMVIEGGKFNPQVIFAPGQEEYNHLGEGKQWLELGEGWWQVVPTIAPEIEYVTFTVNVDADSIESYTVTTNGQDVADNDGSYVVQSNAVVTITATPKTGYGAAAFASEDVTVSDAGVFTASVDPIEIAVSAEKQTFTVTFKVEDQADIVSNDVAYGTAFANVKPADPVVAGKNFTGWTPVVATIDGTELVFTAQFEVQTFTVTFLNDDDTEYAVSNDVPYNTAFNDVKPADPTKADYTFAGWIPAGEPVISNSTYKATFTLNTYAITWAESENVVATNNGVQVESGITLAKDATITFYPTVGSITNIVVDSETVAVSSPYTFTVKAQASVLKVLAGETAAPSPTPVDPSQGTIVPDGEGNFVITPTGSEITVQNPGDNKFIVDVATDFTIKGVAAANITVKCNGEDITAVCKGGDAEGFSTELDPAKTTPELIEATATEQPLVVGTTVDLKIKQSVAGLAYKLLRVGEVGDFSDSTKITPVATQKGNGETLTLTDANKPANKAFYKVAVGKDVINESAD